MFRKFLKLRRAIPFNISRQSRNESVRYYRAAVCSELGKPLTLENFERKKLNPGEVRVGVQAAGINFSDLLMVQGIYQERPPLPFVAGAEFAGKVLEVGEDVKKFKEGDHVLGLTMKLGAFAEELVATEMEIWPVSPSISFSTAASIGCSYGTAWMALTRRANVQQGETVLVTAAAGGVGLATVDMASHVLGAKVIGAAGGPDKCKLVEDRGAFTCIDYRQDSVKEKVAELTERQGANVIFDAVGGDIFKQCLSSVAWEGRIVVIGFAGGDIPKVPANILLVKNVTVHGFYWGQHSMKDFAAFRKSIDEPIKFTEEGKIKPYVGQIHKLDEVNVAMKSIISRQSTGKVVLRM